jgi:hypothetical protein
MVTKKGAGKSKASGAASKAAGSGSKAAGGSSKADGRSSKADGGGSKAAGGGVVTGVKKPSVFPEVPLKAPSRTGRSVRNVADAIEEFEFRLAVAEKYLQALRPALALGDAFLATGWTAVGVLKVPVVSAGDGAGARAARTTMVGEASVVRDIVVRLTRAGDPARDAVLVGKVLDPNLFASVDQCKSILAGAKEIQGRFAALTDDLLKELAVAVDKAHDASGERKDERTSTAVGRLAGSDQRQLAVDVMLDCADQLAAAAMSRLRSSNPNVVARLSRALEPDNDPDPTPAPPPA